MTDWRLHIHDFTRDIWEEGRLSAVEDYIAPRYELFHTPGDPWHGKVLDHKAYKERMVTLREAFPDQKFDYRHVLVEGGQIGLFWTWKGTHRAEVAGFAATGRPVTMSGATWYGVAGDKLTGHWQITDRLDVYQQLMANKAAQS